MYRSVSNRNSLVIELSALGHNYGDVFSGLAPLDQAASGKEAVPVSSFARSAVRSWRVNLH